MKYGTVLRRDDGLKVMVICPGTEIGLKTDEGVEAKSGDFVVLVLARPPRMDTEDPPAPYWPLHRTASCTPTKGSFTWEVLS